MATGGVGSLATKNTCSICLEPFKGRFPKLLPCFHTFCLPCLNQMVTRTVSQVGQFGSGQTETIITCPNCRKDCVVPSGGVAELQKNFYIEQEEDAGQGHLQPIICDLCDQGQVASHRCTRCQLMLCFHCHRGHSNCQIAVRANNERGDDASADESLQQLVEKGRDQMKVVERMLNKLAENKLELNQQRKKLETSLLKKIKSHADAEVDQMKKDEAGLQSKLDALSQLLYDAEPSALSATSLKSALLPDADVSKMRGQTELDSKQTDFFKPLSASLNLGSAVQGVSDAGFDDGLLFGDGNQQPVEASQSQQAARVNELAQKVDMLMRQAHEQKTRGENKELIAEIRAMHDKNTILLQEVATVQGVVQALQTENEKLQMESGRIRKDFTDLKAESGKTGDLKKDFTDIQAGFQELSKDHSAMLKQNSRMSSDFSDLQKDVTAQQKVIDEHKNTKQEMVDMKEKVRTLSKEISSSSEHVDRHSSELVELKTQLSHIQGQAGRTTAALTTAQPQSAEQDKAVARDLQSLKDSVAHLKQKSDQFSVSKADAVDLQRLKDYLSTKVAFRAVLIGSVMSRTERVLICKEVFINCGNGYNVQNGKFHAPVAGLYIFCASVMPFLSDRKAVGSVMYFDSSQANLKNVLCVCESHDTAIPCSGQGVIHLAKGQEVWLETFNESSSFSDLNCGTQFCGILIQPDMF